MRSGENNARINTPKLKGVFAEKGITHEMLAKEIGIDKLIFSRKISADGLNFSIEGAHKIAEILNLSQSDAVDIFCIITLDNASKEPKNNLRSEFTKIISQHFYTEMHCNEKYRRHFCFLTRLHREVLPVANYPFLYGRIHTVSLSCFW